MRYKNGGKPRGWGLAPLSGVAGEMRKRAWVSKAALVRYSYFNLIMSDQRVVGFGLLKSCLMALAKTLALPLPSFLVYCWAPMTIVSEPLRRLIRSMTWSRRRIFSICSALMSNRSCWMGLSGPTPITITPAFLYW